MEAMDVKELASRAARSTAAEPPDSDQVFDRADVLRLVGIGRPQCSNYQQFKAWELWELQFINRWRDQVLERIGRYAMTNHAGGLQLLTPVESVAYGERRAWERMGAEAARARSIIRYADVSAMSTVERQEKEDAERRVGRLQSMVSVAKRERHDNNSTASAPAVEPEYPRGMQ